MTTDTPLRRWKNPTGFELASWSVLEQLARALRVPEADLQGTLDAMARTAVETIGPAKYAGVNLYDHGKFVPQAVAGDPPHGAGRAAAGDRDRPLHRLVP